MNYKLLIKNQYRKIKRSIRRLQPQPSPVIMSLNLIKKAKIASNKYESRKTPTFVIDGKPMLLPAFRGDGVGIQAMVRICVMYLAKQTSATYIHLPFLKLAHQNIDPMGCSLSQEEWARKWEEFFNFGKGEICISDLANAMGEETLAKYMSAEDCQFYDPPQNIVRDRLPSLLERIRECDREASEVFTFGLGLCRQSRECQLFPDTEFIKTLQEKFETNGYVPEEMLFSEQFLNIAIHIRRGDVWDACQAGSKKKWYTNKLVSEEYYVELLQRLQNFFKSSSKPVCFHIFSDGRPGNFGKFTFISDHEAFLKLNSGFLIKNVQFHLRNNTMDALYHMIKAPILVPGKSTFSVVAALLNNSYVFYENEICEFYQYDILKEQIEENPMFISITDLENKFVDATKVFSNLGLMN